MCTRFYMEADTDETREINVQVLRSPLSDKFIRAEDPILTSGEIRPTDVVPVIAPSQKGKNVAFPMKWGFRLPKGSLVVNARVETAATKPVFQEAWEKHRCIIPDWISPGNKPEAIVPYALTDMVAEKAEDS